METTKLPDVQDLIAYIYKEIERKRDNSKLKTYIPYLELMANYFERVVKAKEEKKHIVAHTTMLPVEIFYAMDLVPLFIEGYCLFINFFEDVQSFLEIAAGHGIPPEICSVHRVTDAMVITDTFPQADSFVFSSLVCDNTPKGGEGMAALGNAPGYLLDRPYKITENGLAYWKEELGDLIHFLEEQTGRKMDYDRLREAVRLSYRVTELCQELNELRKAVPEPMPAEAIFSQFAIPWMFAGTPEGVTILEQLRDEIKERVKNKIGAVPNERFRIMYTLYYPYWDMEIMDILEKEYGAAMVMNFLECWAEKGEWIVDSPDPLDSLAKKTSVFPGSYHLHGPMANWVDDIVRIAKEYKADGAIFFSHIACRQGCAAIRAIKDTLEDIEIPMAVVDCDIVDKSFTSRKEVMDKLEGFFEILEGQK